MVKVNCLNKISKAGMKLFSDNYEIVDDFAQADAALVRSAAMHDMEQGREQELTISLLINVLQRVLLSLIHRVQMQMV